MAYNQRSKSGMNPYAAGSKVYGGGRSFPTMGPVGDRMGYNERDLKHRARRDAILRRLKAKSKGKHASSDALRKV